MKRSERAPYIWLSTLTLTNGRTKSMNYERIDQNIVIIKNLFFHSFTITEPYGL